jgi:mannose-6-phosphate isomerase-like protein (cupin superfamily)
MKKSPIILLLLFTLCAGASFVKSQGPAPKTEGYVIERDADVAKNEPGPHDGGGPSTGYIFFEKVPDLKFSFRKRVLHKGAAIGYHLQKTDEVYYILGGTGKMTMNGRVFPVKRGDAILTRGGSSHGLVQTGVRDLTIIISYQKE